MLKVNEKCLIDFSTSATPVDREGYLAKRGYVNKTYQRRWFVLKGNLLFYFEKRGDKEPVGAIILEGCSIELSEDDDLFSFKIVFHTPGGRSYTLCAQSQSSMEQWMKALACAGYDYMKLMVCELQRQLDEIEESANATPEKPVEPKVPPRGMRYNPFNETPVMSGKVVPGSRHNKDSARSCDSSPRKNVSFRELHTMYGRRILADRNEWRVTRTKRQREEQQNGETVEVSTLVQL